MLFLNAIFKGTKISDFDISTCILFLSLPLSQSFIIKSIERNIDCVYIARQTILDIACSSASRPAQLPLHPQPGIQTMEQIEELSGKKNWKKFLLEFKFL